MTQTPADSRRGSLKAVGLYLASRVTLTAVLLLVVSFVVFSLSYVAPGDQLDALAGDYPRSPETEAALTEQYGLDRPMYEQYLAWLQDAVTLDFGVSLTTRQSVTTEIVDRLGVTLFLGGYAFLIALLVGIPLGVLAAIKRGTGWDRLAVMISIVGVSAPAFVTGLVLLYLLGVRWPVFPTYGAGDGFLERATHLTLPAVALAFTALGLIVKFTRSALSSTLEQDYVAFARARGVREREVVLRYGLRNAALPMITAIGLILIGMLSGSVLVEQTFSLPGVGRRVVEAVTTSDVPMVQGLALLVAATVAAISLLIDLAYFAASPELRRRFSS